MRTTRLDVAHQEERNEDDTQDSKKEKKIPPPTGLGGKEGTNSRVDKHFK